MADLFRGPGPGRFIPVESPGDQHRRPRVVAFNDMKRGLPARAFAEGSFREGNLGAEGREELSNAQEQECTPSKEAGEAHPEHRVIALQYESDLDAEQWARPRQAR